MASQGDLTNPKHWDRVHQDLLYTREQLENFPQFPWMPEVLRQLEPYRGQRFLELGCSPGQVSGMIATQLPMQFEGVDFSESAEIYLDTMRTAGAGDAALHLADLREFHPPRQYDVVASFGLVEHFDDPQPVLDHHDRLLRPGGLCIVELPRFRGIPKLFKWAFDRPNLRGHNTRMMEVGTFERFAQRAGHEVLFLDIVGGPQVWGYDTSGPEWLARMRKGTALRIKRFVTERIKPHVRPGHPLWAPWMLYIGRKPEC